MTVGVQWAAPRFAGMWLYPILAKKWFTLGAPLPVVAGTVPLKGFQQHHTTAQWRYTIIKIMKEKKKQKKQKRKTNETQKMNIFINRKIKKTVSQVITDLPYWWLWLQNWLLSRNWCFEGAIYPIVFFGSVIFHCYRYCWDLQIQYLKTGSTRCSLSLVNARFEYDMAPVSLLCENCWLLLFYFFNSF